MKKYKINKEIFIIPKSRFLSKLALSKYDFERIDLYDETPCVYISPKTAVIDYDLITNCMTSKFVFLHEKIVTKINTSQLNKKQQDLILNEIEENKKHGYSLALLWSSNPTIFGNNLPVSKELALFLSKTKMDIKFLTFPGEYFAYPIWANKPRPNKIFAYQKITIKSYMLKNLNNNEIHEVFINSTPSSATNYAHKFPVHIKSNNKAVGLEKLIYCCPTCNKLLNLYSEFSCIKCRNCGSAFELSQDGLVLFSKKFNSIEEIENYQFKALAKSNFKKDMISKYTQITQILSEKCKKISKIPVILQIYAEKLIIKNTRNNSETTIYYEDVDSIKELSNNIIIKTKNANLIHFIRNSNENFIIIKDLVKINQN